MWRGARTGVEGAASLVRGTMMPVALSMRGGMASPSSSVSVLTRSMFICPRFCPAVDPPCAAARIEPSRQLSPVLPLLDGVSEFLVSTLSAYICLREYPIGLPSRGRPMGGPTSSWCISVMYDGGFFFAFGVGLSVEVGLEGGGEILAVAGDGPL